MSSTTRACALFAVAVALAACGSGSSSGERGGVAGESGESGTGGEGGDSSGGVEPSPPSVPEYALLSETGLFADIAADELADGVTQFEPNYVLWSDGAEKRRWVQLPEGASIDSSDPDHWQLPIGARFWKEFSIDGTRVETRLIERYGAGSSDYFMGAFVWRDNGSDAELRLDGEDDARGTTHDVPSQKQCRACHNGEPGRVLGFSALQLSREDSARGPTLAELAAEGRLTDPPDDAALITPPGDDVTARAFGYLHANCGNCHNLNGTAWPDTQMVLRLSIGEREADATELYLSVVNQPLQNFRDEEATARVVPGDPAQSGLVVRMSRRGPREQMPPLASEVVDDAGVELVTSWISSLSARASSDRP